MMSETPVEMSESRVYLDNYGNECASKEEAIESIKTHLRIMGFKDPQVWRIAYRNKRKETSLKKTSLVKKLMSKPWALVAIALIWIAFFLFKFLAQN